MPVLIRVWIPAFILIVAAAVGYLANILKVQGYSSLHFDLIDAINTEGGFIEIATVLVLGIAIYQGLRTLGPVKNLQQPFLFSWIALNMAGATYFLGEEISWGQHFFNWSTGEWFAEHNDQGETNLHNISSWLDQKPRLLLLLWCVTGGLIVPLWYKARKLHRPTSGWSYWFWPTNAVIFVAILIAVIRIPDNILDFLEVDVSDPVRLYFQSFNATEIQECFYGCFILIYMYAIRTRVRVLSDSAQPSVSTPNEQS